MPWTEIVYNGQKYESGLWIFSQSCKSLFYIFYLVFVIHENKPPEGKDPPWMRFSPFVYIKYSCVIMSLVSFLHESCGNSIKWKCIMGETGNICTCKVFSMCIVPFIFWPSPVLLQETIETSFLHFNIFIFLCVRLKMGFNMQQQFLKTKKCNRRPMSWRMVCVGCTAVPLLRSKC